MTLITGRTGRRREVKNGINFGRLGIFGSESLKNGIEIGGRVLDNVGFDKNEVGFFEQITDVALAAADKVIDSNQQSAFFE
ncbi:hypothetical protein SDC9_85008 [bioreactor metagenome]|uniref:Uncharacterized protein n=1 Tax=bioreactor metagenome TaxID=1076179 RepID=A0A644ZCB3_9ZZZZ